MIYLDQAVAATVRALRQRDQDLTALGAAMLQRGDTKGAEAIFATRDHFQFVADWLESPEGYDRVAEKL